MFRLPQLNQVSALVTKRQVLSSYQSVSVDTLAFMHPQVHEFLGCLELIWLSDQKSLEHIAEMPDVELVVEVRCRLTEVRCDLLEGSKR